MCHQRPPLERCEYLLLSLLIAHLSTLCFTNCPVIHNLSVSFIKSFLSASYFLHLTSSNIIPDSIVTRVILMLSCDVKCTGEMSLSHSQRGLFCECEACESACRSGPRGGADARSRARAARTEAAAAAAGEGHSDGGVHQTRAERRLHCSQSHQTQSADRSEQTHNPEQTPVDSRLDRKRLQTPVSVSFSMW